ncbi:MAG TPA: DUF4041 domain-containing protein [Nostocaceae cyanobacterium]|nr:DUF4041 domain-containing protein [Nostocaceae cyanobacterium]
MLYIIFVIIIVILICIFSYKIHTLTQNAKKIQTDLKEQLYKYENLISKEEYEKQLDSRSNLLQNEISMLIKQQENLHNQISILERKLYELEEVDYVQSFGFYKSKYNFGTSEEYQIKLDDIRNKQKDLISKKLAAICRTEWTVEGSRKKGEKMTNDFLKLVLRAFNGECDAAVLKVKYNNVTSLEKRINKAFETLNKLSESTRCEITNDYFNLKLEELYLTHEFQEKKQEEMEEQRRIREQMKEEERVIREIEKAKEEAEREEKRYEQALVKARQEIEKATGQEREKLEDKVKQLIQQLEESKSNKERALSRAQMTKSGYVYVISNIGSFGNDVYKIGMTRRLEPSERIKELSGASVPFSFDIHAMIFSEDAPQLENLLHKYFEHRRINKVNERKEFFRVSLDEISLAIKQLSEQFKSVKSEIKFTKIAEAVEYRKTLAMERSENN